MDMNYCMQCGCRLRIKEHETEGPTPWCDDCGAFRYPVFNTAVSMIITNPDQSRVLLIRQYGKPYYVLVAGYVNKGEDAEDAAAREVLEEIGLQIRSICYNRSHYYAKSNTLMLNYTVTVDDAKAHPNWEVDDWGWFSPEEARRQIRLGSLAAVFFNGYFEGEYHFEQFRPDSYR